MSKQTLLYVVLAAAVVGSLYYATQEHKDQFGDWKRKFGVEFTESENLYRSLIFYKNLNIIESHNSNKDRTYDMGINQFSALTDEEFVNLHLSPKPYNPEWENVDTTFNAVGNEIDWVAKGWVSPVKNQGQCGSCWAFSAVAVLESFGLSKGQTVYLSEQQLVDCSRKYGNQGCNGGFNYQGLAYVKDNGITTEAAYAYTAKTGTCKTDGGSFKIASVQTAKGCPGIQTAIATRPIGVSADATNWSKYSSGIFSGCGTNLNHDIFLVGMSDTYWKIKNSWGTSWGEKGFIRLAPGNTCGVCIDKSPWVQ